MSDQSKVCTIFNQLNDNFSENEEEEETKKFCEFAVKKTNDEIVVEKLFESGYLEHSDAMNLIQAKKSYEIEFYNSVTEMNRKLFNLKDPFTFLFLKILMTKFGSKVVHLAISTEHKLQIAMLFILKYCKKLKDLSIESTKYNNFVIYDASKISCLKGLQKVEVLKLSGFPALNYIADLESPLKNLAELYIDLDEINEAELQILISFLNSQRGLKKLSLNIQFSTVADILPTINDNVKYSLTEFHFSVGNTNLDNFSGFLKIHPNLEKIVIGENMDENFFVPEQFLNANNEQRQEEQQIQQEEHSVINFDNIHHFEDKRSITNASQIASIFSFLKILKVVSIIARQPTFFRLHTLEIDYSRSVVLKNIFAPILKIFKIKKFPHCDGTFNTFMHSINSVEILIIESVSSTNDILHIVRMMKFFPNLKMFTLTHEKLDKNQEIKGSERRYKYKIVIDDLKKIVIISCHVHRNCAEIMRTLMSYFGNFEFKVFCIQDPSNTRSIFVPAQNVIERFNASYGFYCDPRTNAILENYLCYGNLIDLFIPDYPFDYNGGKVLKLIIEQMKLQNLQIKNKYLIFNGHKQQLNEISISSNQISSLYEMIKQFGTLMTVKLELTSNQVDVEEIEAIIRPDTNIFERVQELEIIDNSTDSLLSIFSKLIQKFTKIFRLRISTQDQSINFLLSDFLPRMICLEKLYIDGFTTNIQGRLISINDNARRLRDIYVNREYVKITKEFFEQENPLITVIEL